MLKIHNDLTGQKEQFKSIEPGKVRMYVCGMTVYDYCHLGHARAMVVFDIVYRYLMELGYDVTYIRNITDIDDKIIQRANENNEPIGELTARFIQALREDADALGILRPSDEPAATAYVPEIIAMVEKLIENGHAYAVENGDVYYSTSSFKSYGQLSGKTIEDLVSGARVEVGDIKREPTDFALWKSAKEGEPFWDSPWGKGRPGWHIECSAMSTCTLGNHFDIHGGGADLTFPHHENEIAQSEGATCEKYVNYWMHNGFVRINDEKMSKSLGNFFTIREILERYDAETVRYFILTSQYRSPLNYGDEHLDNARAALNRFYTALRDIPEATASGGEDIVARFHAAMQDDFNTPIALAAMFDLTRELNKLRGKDMDSAAGLAAQLKKMGQLLGILQSDPASFLKGTASTDGADSAEIDQLVEQRVQAKKDKDWAKADELRDQLTELGIVLEDSASGTTWRRK